MRDAELAHGPPYWPWRTELEGESRWVSAEVFGLQKLDLFFGLRGQLGRQGMRSLPRWAKYRASVNQDRRNTRLAQA